ncbi:CycL1 [Intoshia linei]|uniref:CycL1 n=1 Tax=Intoshia linei TaxID=1819745 RepID=A0A177B8C8_9BILA|nr:CycL1 [Intoshia linei]
MINNTITTNFAPLLPQSEENKVGSTTDVNILLSLENSLIPDLLEKENEKKSFDQQNGLIDDNIYDLRYFGAHLIQVAGILLELPQVVMATGQVLYQRFFCKNSFIKHDFDIYAFASLYLAAKIEEHPKRLRVILVVSNHIVQLLANSKIKPLTIEVVHKNRLISAERKLLKDLGFCVHVKHPHKMPEQLVEGRDQLAALIIVYCRLVYKLKKLIIVNPVLAIFNNGTRECQIDLGRLRNYMNDALRTTLFVQFSPETIACGCIYLAARDQEKPLPDNPHWYYLYGASTKDVKSISIQLVKLYEREKPSYSSLIKLVKECKDKSVKRKIDSLTIGGSIDQLLIRYGESTVIEILLNLPVQCIILVTSGSEVDVYNIMSQISMEHTYTVHRHKDTLHFKIPNSHTLVRVSTLEYTALCTKNYYTNFHSYSERRDVTIDAMFITMDGKLIDYHNGYCDLNNSTIKFIPVDNCHVLCAFWYATEVSKHSIKNKHKHKSKTDSHSEHRHRDKHKNHVKSSKKSRSRENKNDYHSRRHKVYNRKRYHSSDDDSDHKMKMRSRSLKKISSRLDLHKISVKEETNNHYRNHKT